MMGALTWEVRFHNWGKIHDRHIVGRFLVAFVVYPLVSGCSETPTSAQTTSAQEINTQQMMIRIQQDNSEFAAITASHLPSDYQRKAQTWFENDLIDPDSRKVKFTTTPTGSLFCGWVNAKNRLGGYTGQAPFYGYFDTSGKLSMDIINDGFLAIKSAEPGDPFWRLHWILTKCGML